MRPTAELILICFSNRDDEEEREEEGRGERGQRALGRIGQLRWLFFFGGILGFLVGSLRGGASGLQGYPAHKNPPPP